MISKKTLSLRKNSGKCVRHSDRNVVLDRFMCQECLDYMKIRRDKLRTYGKCQNHSDRDVATGKSKCQECLNYEINRGMKNREKKYGVSYPTWWLCDCCNRSISKTNINLDHDHVTGQFRGWLCDYCNSGLGFSEGFVMFQKYLKIFGDKPISKPKALKLQRKKK